jgi:myo-inositol-1(or 4)-monophosphatase
MVKLDDLIGILQEASAAVLKCYEGGGNFRVKADNSFLTEADVLANRVLRAGLSRLLPSAGWLSEESRDDPSRLDADCVWIVDPLDGTREFVRKVPEFAVSIGLVTRGRVIAGAVVNPVNGYGGAGIVGGELRFWGGIELDTLAGVGSLSQATASIGRSEFEDGSVLSVMGLVGKTYPVGSVAYKLLRVAAGRENLTFSVQPKSEWDICGGVGLLNAAGKVYSRFDGAPLAFNSPDTRIHSGAVAGEPILVEEFLLRLGTDGIGTSLPDLAAERGYPR